MKFLRGELRFLDDRPRTRKHYAYLLAVETVSGDQTRARITRVGETFEHHYLGNGAIYAKTSLRVYDVLFHGEVFCTISSLNERAVK